MAMTIADAEELLRFSALLETYVNNISRETRAVTTGFNVLKGTWHDEKAEAFEGRLRELLGAFNSFKSNTDELIPHLRIMAQHLKDYHTS